MLELTDVTRRFGAMTAVDAVSLSIPDGQMVGVIGRSGAGKSTLLRMINRLSPVSSGTIVHKGRPISTLTGGELRTWQRDCAMIFQQFNLVPRLDVLTNVMLGRLNRRSTVFNLLNMFSVEERAAALSALERLGIAQAATQMAGTLSGGQQQRVAIARALMQEPAMILADEPIASLDPLNAQIVMDALEDINRREGITVITNLHTLDTARAYCERVIGMAAGRVVFDGPPEELTSEAVAMIYGASGDGDGISESITSTSLSGGREPVPARPKSTGALQPALYAKPAAAGVALPA
ncbi:phosphonate ABC transporter ATP-binding protein [Hoeflea olei]|uniref:Phosphonate ABC transporter ATP-binding protein n=1 Tax=Hoeflea olei TaxID=1480615 RepID=A0A1C1YWP0_9HYPH|nr:phosphonate ABC transporter ATP-binding protein [Hoeflea olei]OCW57830.1 phosphonate ABC transporter ATP-binding protein [Hoeflea olei]